MAKRIVYVLDTIVFCLSILLFIICLILYNKDGDDPFSMNYLSKVYYNWKRSPIEDVNFSEQPKEFQVIPITTYEGNYHGCRCTDENNLFTYKVNKTCSDEDIQKNCTDIPEKSPKVLDFSMALFAYYKLSSKTYSYYLETAVSKDEECPTGYHQCGILDTAGNKMCLNETCPINSINWNDCISYNTEVNNSIMLTFNGTVGEMCLHSSYKDNKNNDPNYNIYPLSKGIDHYGCPKVYKDLSIDNRFSLIGKEELSILYSLSDLQYLSDFERINNKDQKIIQYYLVNYIGLNLTCYNKYKEQYKVGIFNNDNLSQTLYYYKMSRNIELVLLLFYSLMIFLGLVHWFIILRKQYRLMNKLENQIWTMKVLLSFFSCFIIVSFYWSSKAFTVPHECFIEEFEQVSMKQASESIKKWKILDLCMIVISLLCGLICFGRDFLNKDDIIQADYIQYIKPKEEDEMDTSSFYEDRNSSAASIDVEHSLNNNNEDISIRD